MWSFEPGFFHLAERIWDSSILLHILVVCSFFCFMGEPAVCRTFKLLSVSGNYEQSRQNLSSAGFRVNIMYSFFLDKHTEVKLLEQVVYLTF